jgi:ATP-dependent exoDNAse (exonuclease V) beta subunit
MRTGSAKRQSHGMRHARPYADVAAGIGSALLAALSAELDELLGEYEQVKLEAAALDFDDLLHHADRLP